MASTDNVLGFVNVFKPAGPTSAAIVARVRRAFAGARTGHLGTLDPQAAGVLPIAFGKATRLIPMLEDRRKSYVCTLVLGRSTTTADAHGETIATGELPADWRERLAAALPGFEGQGVQTPPMYSAVHHEGKRLYELAREGKTVERKSRPIVIYALRILGFEDGIARLRIACGEGTYVRTLCEDLGAAIGVPAHMGTLLREAAGPFVLYESRTLEQIDAHPADALISPERVFPFPTIVLEPRSAADFQAGRIVPLPAGAGAKHVFVRDSGRALVGVGEALGTLLAPRKVFV